MAGRNLIESIGGYSSLRDTVHNHIRQELIEGRIKLEIGLYPVGFIDRISVFVHFAGRQMFVP